MIDNNVAEEDISQCQQIGYQNLEIVALDLGNGSNMMVLLSATLLFLGVANWLISNTKLMILMKLNTSQ